MTHTFLSDAWFTEVDALIAAAGDLQIPEPMKAAFMNVTITSPTGETQIVVRDGVFARGHQPDAPTRVKLDAGLARKIFVDADAVAGVQAFLAGEIHVEGDLARLVAMQTTEPSDAQKRLSQRIAAITS